MHTLPHFYLVQDFIRIPNLSWYILYGCQNRVFHIVSRKKTKNETDCVVEQDALCICADALPPCFRTKIPYQELAKWGTNRRLTMGDLISRGREHGSARKRIHGRRYLKPSLAALKRRHTLTDFICSRYST